jgi:hypothetical protein
MQTNEKAAEAGRSLDEESQGMIYEGLNITQLEIIMEMDKKTIREKLFKGRVQPSGRRNGADIYKLTDVMPFLVKPQFDIESYIRDMHHNDLPKMLTKEFWAGQRAKQEWEEKAGNLWPTEKVVEAIGEVCKLVKMSVMLVTETVERQVELTPKQRDIIKRQHDGLLIELSKMVKARFAGDEDEYDAQEEDEAL